MFYKYKHKYNPKIDFQFIYYLNPKLNMKENYYELKGIFNENKKVCLGPRFLFQQLREHPKTFPQKVNIPK